jgi:hypothetical protein
VAQAANRDTTWISYAEALRLAGEIYGSKAGAIVGRLLKEKKLRWQCAEIRGQRRASDPDNGDPNFWTGAELTGRPEEGWVRRRVLEPGRPINRRPAVLADYIAFGIEFAREDLIANLPAAAIGTGLLSHVAGRPEVESHEAPCDALQEADGSSTPTTLEQPRQKEREAYWDKSVDRALSELFPNNDAKNCQPKVVVKKVLDALAPEITKSGRPGPTRATILRKTGHWRA